MRKNRTWQIAWKMSFIFTLFQASCMLCGGWEEKERFPAFGGPWKWRHLENYLFSYFLPFLEIFDVITKCPPKIPTASLSILASSPRCQLTEIAFNAICKMNRWLNTSFYPNLWSLHYFNLELFKPRDITSESSPKLSQVKALTMLKKLFPLNEKLFCGNFKARRR